MSTERLNQQERDALMAEWSASMETYERLQDQGRHDEAFQWLDKARALQREYARRVPIVTVSCCPFDGKPLERTFDPFDLAGFWWRQGFVADEPPTCKHFCVMRGAVHYHGQTPRAGRFTTRPGPEVPYVLPRLLRKRGMVAVLSEIRMANGYTAYPVVYFARFRPLKRWLTAGWGESIHTYEGWGGAAWKIANDAWDFDLLPWLRSGKIRWCEPGTGNTVLSQDPPEQCPYLDIPGERRSFHIYPDGYHTYAAPDGTAVGPHDWDP